MQVELLEWNFWHGAESTVQVRPGFSGRAGRVLKFVKILRANFGSAYKTFL